MAEVRDSGTPFQGSAVTTVNMLEAKTNLSRLVDAVESGAEREIIIARNGKPAARIVPLQARRPSILGVAKGDFPGYDPSLEDFDADNDAIAKLFYGEAE